MKFFDAFVHSGVIEHAEKDLRCKAHIVSVICKRLEIKENLKLLFEKGEFDYFQSYKGPGHEDLPEPHYLDITADPEEYEQFFKGKFYEALQVKNVANELNELNIKAPSTKSAEIITKTQGSEEKGTGIMEKESKRVIIEVRARKEIKNYDLKIFGNREKGEVNIFEHTNEIEINVSLAEENSMKNIILDANATQIKLSSQFYSFELKLLNKKMNDSKISARWLKKAKKLIVKCPYLA